MGPYKGDTPSFIDNKGEPWGLVLRHEQKLRFLFTYIVLI